jgi:hypothetical protein
MVKRKTVADIRAAARMDAMAEACRILKWHLGHGAIADALWTAVNSGKELREGADSYLDEIDARVDGLSVARH